MKNRILKFVVSIIGICFLIVLGYYCYLQITYERIPDYEQVTIHNTEHVTEKMELQKEYTICSYNIGFGAYSDDYSFFMDGGKYSRAFDKAAVKENVSGALETVKQFQPDFFLIQEVDQDSTRSYHIDEIKMVKDAFPEYANNYASNFHSKYLFYPIYEPHGASNAGLSTFSKFKMLSSIRRSLPISTSAFKLIDLDRCYVATRIAVENGKELVLYNVHLSAYTVDDNIVINQIKMLVEDMQQEIAVGNYVLCGGDFNQDMLGNSPDLFRTSHDLSNWATPFPEEVLPEHIVTMTSLMSEKDIRSLAPSCRTADAPYKEGESFVTFIDGFLMSDNIQMIEFQSIDTGFRYSDHNPVIMKIRIEK